MRRGAIVRINLSDVSPPEMGKTRPGLVISNTDQNLVLETIVIIPLSTRPGEMWPLRLRIDLPKTKRSYAVVPGIRQMSKTRLLDTICFANGTFLRKVEEALVVYLGD
jgi:mRNA-degrading endonuclease toxin of MazEF toxin-antitoxin module